MTVGPLSLIIKPMTTHEIMNGTAVLTIEGNKSTLTIKPGFLPLRAINPIITDLDKEGLKIAAQNASVS